MAQIERVSSHLDSSARRRDTDIEPLSVAATEFRVIGRFKSLLSERKRDGRSAPLSGSFGSGSIVRSKRSLRSRSSSYESNIYL